MLFLCFYKLNMKRRIKLGPDVVHLIFYRVVKGNI